MVPSFTFFLDLMNIFNVFLPQLLRYPNPTDPLNGEAAALLLKDPGAYERKVREYTKKYACILQEAICDGSELGSIDEHTVLSEGEIEF